MNGRQRLPSEAVDGRRAGGPGEERRSGGLRAACRSLARTPRRAARLIIRDREHARDVVQETLVRAWRSLPSLRDPERFEGWLRQLLVRACIDELRSMRRHVVEIELPDMFQPAVADSAAAVVDRGSLRRAFRWLDSAPTFLMASGELSSALTHTFERQPIQTIAASSSAQ
jgi:RNA polymerase sigma factor (sigma-70 family)